MGNTSSKFKPSEICFITGITRKRLHQLSVAGKLSLNKSSNGYRNYTRETINEIYTLNLLDKLDINLDSFWKDISISKLARNFWPVIRELMVQKLTEYETYMKNIDNFYKGIENETLTFHKSRVQGYRIIKKEVKWTQIFNSLSILSDKYKKIYIIPVKNNLKFTKDSIVNLCVKSISLEAIDTDILLPGYSSICSIESVEGLHAINSNLEGLYMQIKLEAQYKLYKKIPILIEFDFTKLIPEIGTYIPVTKLT